MPLYLITNPATPTSTAPGKGWVFLLADSLTMTPLGEFTKAKNRSLALKLNSAGSYSCDVSMDDPLAPLITPVETCIVAYQDGVIRWSGPVITARDALPERTVQIQAVGWYELLNHRTVRDNVADWNASLISNPSFTFNASSWSLNANGLWAASGGRTDPGCITFDGANPAGGGTAAPPLFTSPANVSLQAEFWFYAPTPWRIDPTGSIGIEILEFADGTTYDTSAVWNGATTPDVWNRVTVSWLGHGGSTSLQLIAIANPAAPGVFVRIDDVQVYEEQGVYSDLDIGEIALRLVDYAGQRWACPVTRGIAQPAWNRTIEFRPFANIGQEITRMSNVENGFDMNVDPATRELNIYWPMRGQLRTGYDTSQRLHEKLGATYLWKFDTANYQPDTISGITPTPGTALSHTIAASLQSYEPGTAAYGAVLDPAGGHTYMTIFTPSIDLTIAQSNAISLLWSGDLPVGGSAGLMLAGATVPQLFGIAVMPTGLLRFYLGLDATLTPVYLESTVPVSPGVPYHLAACYDANTARGTLYQDGVIVAQTPAQTLDVIPAITANSHLLYLGQSDCTNTPACTIDEVAVWRGRTISPSEVRQIHHTLRERSADDVYAVAFGYGSRDPANLASVTRVRDATWMTNFFVAQGRGSTAGGGAVALDTASMNRFGEWDEVGAVSEIASIDVLSSYAMGEVAVRSQPRTTYEIKPLREPATGNVLVPTPFVDYDVGDIVAFDVEAGTVDVEDESIRIFGITVALDDNGNADVTILTAING